VGLMGFLLYTLDASGILYALGFVVLAVWLALYYHRRLEENYASLMAPVICLLVYILGLLSANAPQWFVAAYAVAILFFLGAKPHIRSFADTLSGDEISTVAKFVIMAGIVLTSASAVQWTGKSVHATSRAGVVSYTYQGSVYELPDDAHKTDLKPRRVTVWLSRSHPDDASKAFIANGIARWSDFVLVVVWFVIAGGFVIGGVMRRRRSL